ncbi:MAG: DUF192 domain-containing protein [Bryobacterales bacterium]|nr:DUF192 domain-containing protein [Bryobacterales bacterium]
MRNIAPAAVALIFIFLLLNCGSSLPPGFQWVQLPDGARIEAETKLTPEGQAQGMMFRASLPENKGMLFIHATVEKRSYWMFQCEIPLDIIWMDRDRRIVEISADTPPCRETAEKCPSYGGAAPSLFVLELAAGMAKKHNLKLGDTLRF